MKRDVSLTALLLLAYSITPAQAAKDDFEIDDGVPSYSNTKLPSITSCDPKNSAADYETGAGTAGGAILQTAMKSAMSVKDSLSKNGDDEEDDIDGKATIDTVCGDPAKISTEDVKDLACKLVTEDYISGKKEEVGKATKILACQRGVLAAMGGEIGCLKKQISSAEKFVDELVNNPGGLATMLKAGNDTLQDRTAQLKTVTDRIEGGPNQNPPGLAAAAKALQELGSKLPALVETATNEVSDMRETQARFESLVTQVETSSILKCMNEPVPGYACVRKGTAGAVRGAKGRMYPAGDVSSIELMQCIYAQSANKVVGDTVVKDPAREEALYTNARVKLTFKGDEEIRGSAEFPMFSDKAAFDKSFRTYEINTPDQLLASLKTKVGTMSVKGKNMMGQLDHDFARCKKKAQARIVADRADSSSPIRASKKSMDSAITKIKSKNAAAFRELRNTYAMALKAATGKSILPDTQGCEKASLEDQVKCFDALNTMVDTLYTGKARSTDGALTGPAMGLTGGANPVRAFLGSVPATNDKNRTLTVACAGVDDCLTKYTSMQKGLQSFTEQYPANLNNSIQAAATNIAAGKNPNTGQPSGMVTLRSVADGIDSVKAKLTAAFSRMSVKDGLDLEPKKIDAPEVDEKTGLYKTASLRNLVLQGLNPGLPDLSSKGFSDATKAITDRDDVLDKKQEDFAKFITALESRRLQCESEATKATKELAEKKCDKAQEALDKCYENAKKDAASLTYADVVTIAAAMQKGSQLPVNTGESKSVNGAPTTGLNCGVRETEKKNACEYSDQIYDSKLKELAEDLKSKKKNRSSYSGDGGGRE